MAYVLPLAVQVPRQILCADLFPLLYLLDQVYDFSAGEEIDGTTQHWKLDHSPRPPWYAPMVSGS